MVDLVLLSVSPLSISGRPGYEWRGHDVTRGHAASPSGNAQVALEGKAKGTKVTLQKEGSSWSINAF